MEKRKVMQYFGTQVKVADFIGKTQQLVSNWEEIIPDRWAIFFDEHTHGALKFDITLYQGRNPE